MSRRRLLGFLTVFVLLLVALAPRLKVVKEYLRVKMSGRKTVSDRLAEFGQTVEQRLSPAFRRALVRYPPDGLAFVALKLEKRFQVCARNAGEPWQWICSYPILAASGVLGPKLKEGDRQVPEGIYAIESFNPNSLFHLSLKLSYPNAFDRKWAQRENRTQLGGDIMIHGNQLSIGCIALGDQASEDVFVLAALTGRENIRAIISPVDFRSTSQWQQPPELPPWTTDLYQDIRQELLALPGETP